MEKLSKKQEFVLDQIRLFIEKNGYSPSIRELCFLTGRNSPATMHFYLKKLKEKGYINYSYNKNRTIKVLVNKEKDIIEKLEDHLLKMFDEYKDSECEENYTIANQSMFIYNYIQELKEKE